MYKWERKKKMLKTKQKALLFLAVVGFIHRYQLSKILRNIYIFFLLLIISTAKLEIKNPPPQKQKKIISFALISASFHDFNSCFLELRLSLLHQCIFFSINPHLFLLVLLCFDSSTVAQFLLPLLSFLLLDGYFW